MDCIFVSAFIGFEKRKIVSHLYRVDTLLVFIAVDFMIFNITPTFWAVDSPPVISPLYKVAVFAIGTILGSNKNIVQVIVNLTALAAWADSPLPIVSKLMPTALIITLNDIEMVTVLILII